MGKLLETIRTYWQMVWTAVKPDQHTWQGAAYGLAAVTLLLIIAFVASVVMGSWTLITLAVLIPLTTLLAFLSGMLTDPISRTTLFASRALAVAVATSLILLVCWLCWAVSGGQTQLNLTWGEFLLPFIPLLAQLLLFGALALLLSFWLPSARLAGMLTGALLVGNYLLMGLYRLNDNLEAVVRLTPFYYYQGGQAVHGLDWGWLAGILMMTGMLTAVSWQLFQRHDIRVGGEGSWQSFRLHRGPRERGAAS